MEHVLNEMPYYNLENYLNYRLNESKQYEMFESIDSSYDIKKEWEETKNIIIDLAKNGLLTFGSGTANMIAGTFNGTKGTVGAGVNAYNKKEVSSNVGDIKKGGKQLLKGTANVIKGSAYISMDVFKLLLKLSKGVMAAVKLLAKTLTRDEVKNTIILILKKFRKDLKYILTKNKKVTARVVLVLLFGCAISYGVHYEVSNEESIYNEYTEMMDLKKAGIENNQAKGVDISSWQVLTEEDWQMIEDNCQFVIIKCGAGFKGPRQDPSFLKHYQEARKHNLKVGIYYFFTDHRDVEAQFNLFQQTMDAIGGKQALDIKPIIDLEDQSLVNKDKEAYKEKVEEFVKLYKKTFNEVPIIYSGAKHLSDYNLDFLYNEYHCPIWTAHYGKDGAGTEYKGKTIDDQKSIFMNTSFNTKDSTVMLQYTDKGDGDLTLPKGLDIDVCWDWNSIKNK